MRNKWDYKSRLNAKQTRDIKQAIGRTQWEASKNWRVKA